MARAQSLLADAAAKALKTEAETSSKSSKNSATRVLTERATILGDLASGRRVDVSRQLVEPEKCRMWRRHNRIYDLLTPEDCADLIDRIDREGQLFPAIARRLKDDPDGYEYEIIAGARRHFAVSYLRNEKEREDLLYAVEIRKLSDEEAFQLSDLENRDRKDISDYERGLDYLSALKEFFGSKVSAMSDKIGMARQSLTNYLNLARLPQGVIEAYGDPRQISIRQAAVLTPLLNNPVKKKLVIVAAKDIAKTQKEAFEIGKSYALDGMAVFNALKQAGNGAGEVVKPKVKPRKNTIKTKDGHKLLSYEQSEKVITLKIPVAMKGREAEIITAMKEVLA